MGQKQQRFHIADDGDVYRVNEDGSYTSMGNVENLTNNKGSQSSFNLRNWLSSNYNWLYTTSIMMLIVSGSLGVCNSYYDESVLGMLSLCAGIASIILPWTFKTISGVWIALSFLLLVAALVTIIAISYERLYTIQIALAFISLLSFGIAHAKNAKLQNK